MFLIFMAYTCTMFLNLYCNVTTGMIFVSVTVKYSSRKGLMLFIYSAISEIVCISTLSHFVRKSPEKKWLRPGSKVYK